VADVAEWLGRTPPPPDYILDGVFETGSRVMLVGSSKTRKSFMAAQLAVCLATGQGFIGIRVPKPRRVLLANLENARD
jgi:RecA-family ATPase